MKLWCLDSIINSRLAGRFWISSIWGQAYKSPPPYLASYTNKPNKPVFWSYGSWWWGLTTEETVLEYEQTLVSNSNSGQRLSPRHTIILKVSAATNICGESSLRKRIWFGKNNTELFLHFSLPNCTQKQHLSGCCCLTCLLNYESLRLFMYLVWKLNLVSLITALHNDDEWYLTRLLGWCVCMWPIEITAPAINTYYHWQCEVQWLVSYFLNTYPSLNL